MPVQQHVLNWLYSVLTSEYHDVNRTYNDIARALTRYPTLTPRTDVYTFTNGSSALLVHISGTIPATFRGSIYRFPVSIWVPHAYPREPPVTYVTPTETMMIRPGQHVDPQGQIYHPYLVGWAEFWDKSTLHDFLGVLSDVFAKEPPVISRQGRASQSPQPVQSPPPLPPLPPEMGSPAPRSTPIGQQPPPPPPKTHDGRTSAAPTTASPSLSPRPSRYDSAPPLPPQAYGSVQSLHPPQPPQQMPPLKHRYSQPPHPPAGNAGYHPGQHQSPAQYPPGWQQAVPPMAHPPQTLPRQPIPQPPPPDLLDEPLTLELPAAQPVNAPPIPPNPEKDLLLHQLAQTLASMRQSSRQQNHSSLAGLQSQRTAMLNTIPLLHSEIGQLDQLSNILTSNATILRESLHKADAVIQGSRSQPAPDIDELLVAPTMVSNQLYQLVAEERALGDAIFMLGRAVEKNRISPAVFAKTTRSLAREWYLKKALVRKIGLGMGLAS